MNNIRRTEDVYTAVEELITELRTSGHDQLATTLEHRMHRVAWTDRTELFEELQRVLTATLASDKTTLEEAVRRRIEQVLRDVGA